MPAVYGLIGYPLEHSFSPAYFNKKFAAQHIDAVYHAFPLKNIDELPSLLQQNPGIKGLSVTIPYKQSVIPYLDETDAVAAAVGAVNCISFVYGIKKGYNTDVIGFEKSLLPLLQPQHTQALILGTGGASKAVAYVLSKLGIVYKKVSRTTGRNIITYGELNDDIISRHPLIINTTPLGTYPNVQDAPQLPFSAINETHLLYDLVYNPEQTQFLSLGKEKGAAIKNGYEMLVLQAEAAWRIWEGG